MNTSKPTTQLLFCATRMIVSHESGTSHGTGFFVRASSGERALITARHVVESAEKLEIRFRLAAPDATGSFELSSELCKLTIHELNAIVVNHPDPSIDLCVLRVERSLAMHPFAPLEPFVIPITRELVLTQARLGELAALEDVVMAGCPATEFDEVNNFALLRKGATATHPFTHCHGQPKGLLDIAMFPGSSGSPVMLLASWALLGIATHSVSWNLDGELVTSGTIRTSTDPVFRTSVPAHLAEYVKAQELLAFFDVLEGCRPSKDPTACH
jgi:hypothetical protein